MFSNETPKHLLVYETPKRAALAPEPRKEHTGKKTTSRDLGRPLMQPALELSRANMSARKKVLAGNLLPASSILRPDYEQITSNPCACAVFLVHAHLLGIRVHAQAQYACTRVHGLVCQVVMFQVCQFAFARFAFQSNLGVFALHIHIASHACPRNPSSQGIARRIQGIR